MRLLVLAVSTVFWCTTMLAQQKAVGVDALKQQLTLARPDSTRLRLCVAIARHYFDQDRYDSLFPYMQQGFELLKTSPSARSASDLYYWQARYYRFRKLYREGIYPSRQAIYYARQAHDVRRIVECQYTLAMIYSDAGDLTAAISQITTNLAYLDKYEDTPTRAANYMLIITLYEELKNKPMQERYLRQYAALDKRAWPPVDRLYASLLEGDELDKTGRLTEGEYHYKQALTWARKTGSPSRIAVALGSLGVNYRKQHRYPESIRCFRQVYALVSPLHITSFMAEAQRELAVTYLANRQLPEALKKARYALQLARQNKQRDGIMAALGCLGDVLTASDLHQEALLVYKEQQALKEQKFSETNTNQLARMQATFDLAARENTISILQKTAQIKRLKELQQQQQIDLARRTQFAGVLIICLLAVLVVVILYFLRKAQHNYALLTQQQQLLQRTAHELTETNRIKDKLFSTIGHDLRSPVANMKTNIRQIREVDQQPHGLPLLIGRLEKQVDNVLTLLSNLLDWSMIQLSAFPLSLQPTVLHDVIGETVSQANDSIEQKQLTIVDQVDKSVVALADKHQLRSVVRNVLSNAIKFSAVGGYIRLLTQQQGQWIELQIRDAGVGMSVEQLAVLFDTPIVRAGTMGESGVGLGLRICREMMDQQQGELLVESDPDKGTIVRIRLRRPTT